ncbi:MULTISPECIES: dihydrofolate reductase family protein [Glycomyces]|uniref:Dihydrofolate reductase n=2 Tax=Glycomyces TaxID=58113 RepID=A0A9X3PMP2_9ACTN|nr:dihydrofolate reductase family protein [Glycomyces lechevalierae]MDA1387627.1 dihydrofolate reductase family protein [Glycomyces lechevalierae]MDR7336606.1 dihydrofolate reductase [Glycomyces lechevalierae]
MTATYTYDVFSSLDGYGAAGGDWTGYWGKQGPELLQHRFEQYSEDQRLVLGATTFRNTARMFAEAPDEIGDAWAQRYRELPATIISSTLDDTLGWPDATIVSGDAVEIIARLKEESPVPLRSHGCLSLNRALLAAGLIDRIQVTIFPVITGRTGLNPVLEVPADFDLELLESHTLDGRIQELIYRPTLHG